MANKDIAQQEKNNIIEKKKNANEFIRENHQKHYVKTTNYHEKAKFIPPCDRFDNSQLSDNLDCDTQSSRKNKKLNDHLSRDNPNNQSRVMSL